MKKHFPALLVLLFVTSTCTLAQSRATNHGRGHYEIIGDVQVNELVQKHIDFNEQVKTIPGFRIQIASLSGSNSRNEAFRKKDAFKATFPEVEAYVIFNEPNFKVVVGDFITRLDAFLFLQKSKDLFPGTIVKDEVYPLRLDWDTIVPETDEDAKY
ncbi:MAG: hypothetical protein SPJ13_02510 [Bacteroidales bacterium]|nr:hypothetical protein [Bacteroidales bacterium]